MTAKLADPSQPRYFLYVGTYEKGIYAFDYSPDEPSFKALGRAGDITNPSFLVADPRNRYLYAVSELEGNKNGAAGAFSMDRKNGSLKALNTASTAGIAPCHLAVDRTSRFLAVANYGSGSVAGFHLERDGSLGAMSSLASATGSSVNPKRQAGPHAHEVVFSANNKFLYVPDLGLDQIRIYAVDAEVGKLTPNEPAYAKETPGMGPRHMAFSPDNRFAYLINELKSFVTVWEHDAELGTLRLLQTISSLEGNPEDRDGAAAIVVHPSGKFVYASNRGPGTIAVFSRNPQSGSLEHMQTVETGGKTPREIQIDPSGAFLLVGDQKTDRFIVLHINPETGELNPIGKGIETPSPVSFVFVPAL